MWKESVAYREKEKTEGKGREENLGPLVHSYIGFSGQDQTRPNPGASGFNPVLSCSSRGLTNGVAFCYFPRCIARELDCTWSI